MIQKKLKEEIAAHAAREYPREACGLIVRVSDVLRYMECRNIAEKEHNFIMDPRDYLIASKAGEIVAVVHSHPDAKPDPSQADFVACEASGLPWHIYSHPAGEWAYIAPSGYKAPLLGRIWVHGVLDCYTFIRDWYREERGIELPDFNRNELWWKKGENIYVENFAKAGFRRIIDEDPQPGDVLLMQILADVPNHGGIYLEGDIVAHHLYNRLSAREVWAGYYRKHTTHILRHEGTNSENSSSR